MERQILDLYPIDYPFETLVQRVKSNPVKLILDPEYQRKYKRDIERASKFIESCLMRIPLPACYFAENAQGNHEVIDGVQRITTINNFFDGKFALEGLTIYQELNGKKISELGELKGELENTTIRCIILRKENPKELINEIFARLNQGAVKLSDQEIRHAIYPGNLDNLLVELGNTEFIASFQNSKEKDDRRNEEIILRYFALNQSLDSYNGGLRKWLDNFMKENQNINEEEVIRLKEMFNSTLSKCVQVFSQPFVNTKSSKGKQGIVYYDLLMRSFNKLNEDFIQNNIDDINIKFNELCEMDDFKKTLSGGLQNRTSILSRRHLRLSKLKEIDDYPD